MSQQDESHNQRGAENIHPRTDQFDIEGMMQFQDEEQLAAYRLSKLRELLRFAWENTPFHRDRWRAIGFHPEDLKSLDDFAKLPLMKKADLRDHNAQLNTIGPGQTREIFTTSGTTGDPVVFRYSRQDLDHLIRQSRDMIQVAGVEKGDLFQMTMPLGVSMWVAGINFWLAFQEAGAGTIRFGPGNSQGQWRTIQSLKPNGIFSTAGFAVRMGQIAQEQRRQEILPIKKLLIVNESISNQDLTRNKIGRLIETLWPTTSVHAVYGNTELGFCGAECDEKQGFHAHPECHYFEVLDPMTNDQLPDGKPGRLVVTSLLYRGLPLIRYCIDDLTFMLRSRCSCGRISDRFGPVLGRLDHMIKLKGGISLFPPAIDNVLFGLPFVRDFYYEVYKDDMQTQLLRIFAVLPEKGESSAFLKQVKSAFLKELKMTPEVYAASTENVAAKIHVPGKRKPQRFHDLRSDIE